MQTQVQQVSSLAPSNELGIAVHHKSRAVGETVFQAPENPGCSTGMAHSEGPAGLHSSAERDTVHTQGEVANFQASTPSNRRDVPTGKVCCTELLLVAADPSSTPM